MVVFIQLANLLVIFRHCSCNEQLGQIKNGVFRVAGMKILGRVGTHIFYLFYSGKKDNCMHFERHLAFQNA